MNILLINVKNPYVDSNNPPLGLGYLSAYLKLYTNDEIKAVNPLYLQYYQIKLFLSKCIHEWML